jgi:gliding motility-associated-like protein
MEKNDFLKPAKITRWSLLFKGLVLVLLANLSSSNSLFSQTPTFQDCLGAIPVCWDSITINYSHNGMGNYSNEIGATSAYTCTATEAKSIWFTFTVQQSGVLRFEINPANQNQDHDWTLFNVTNATCGSLSSTSGANASKVRSNTWGTGGANGSTGVSTPNGGSGTCNGPGTTNGPKWCVDLNVTTGQRFVLHITNWTGTAYGFTLDFSTSTAVIYDNVPPYMDTIISPTDCNSFDSVIVRFSENIKCDSTSAADFQLEGPGGVHTVTSVSSPVCNLGADYALEYTVHFSPAVTQIGNYKLKIIPGDGYVEDICGNLDVSDSIEFEYNGSVELELSGVDPLCYGDCEGEIHAEVTTGAQPFSFAWSGGLTGDTLNTGVCAGQYIVTVTDYADCQRLDTIIIDEPSLLVAAIDTSYEISCPASLNCDGGAKVVATGGVPPYSYLWPSNEVFPFAQGLCAGSNFATVTDAHGCRDSVEVEIGIPDSIVTSGHGETLMCITNFAAVSATSIGGTPPFSYVWTLGSPAGPVVSLTDNFSINPDTTTRYFVKSTDANGCSGDTASVLIKVRPPLGLDIPVPDTICPYDNSLITAFGIGGDSLYTYSWSNGIFGPTIVVEPDLSTWYTVTVSDVCGTPEYVDSVYQQVGGYSPIKASIRAEDDSICPGVNKAIYLIATGYGGFKGPDEYRFHWEHTLDTNRIQFVKPYKTESYVVTITDLCLSEPGIDTIKIYMGHTEFPEIIIEPKEACAKNDVSIFVDKPLPRYKYDWDMGDGTVYQNIPDTLLVHQYTSDGCFDLKLSLLSDFGCSGEMNFPCGVKVLSQPLASFSNFPDYPTNVYPLVTFKNTSRDAATWIWKLDNRVEENLDRFDHEFTEINELYNVQLIVQSNDGCSDTATKTLPYVKETILYYPNSFSPNEDGVNDVFTIIGESISTEGFDLEIFDRWGHQMFRTTNSARGWDGKMPNGDYVSTGVYSFILHYGSYLGERKVISDNIVVTYTGQETGLK